MGNREILIIVVAAIAGAIIVALLIIKNRKDQEDMAADSTGESIEKLREETDKNSASD